MKATPFFLLLLPVFGQDTIGQEQGWGLKEKFREKEQMQEQEKLQVQEHDQEVVLATICKGQGSKTAKNLRRLVLSLLEESENVRILLLVLTDPQSEAQARKVVANIQGQFLTQGVVFGLEDNNVRLRPHFLDLDRMTAKLDRPTIDGMKQLFGPRNKTITLESSDPRRLHYFPDTEPRVALAIPPLGKYDLDLFFVAPFYHRLLPHVKRLIVVDLDVQFRVSVGELASFFSLMAGGQLVAMARDQSPYYQFITGASDQIRQGLNSGVALYDLEGLRASRSYNSQLTVDRMEELSAAILPSPQWNLGDQDWFSLLFWAKPHLFLELPCQYNLLQCQTRASLGAGTSLANSFCGEAAAIAHFCGVEQFV